MSSKNQKRLRKTIIDWSDDWVNTVDEHFTSAFRFYKSKLGGNTIISDSISDSNDEYATFIANKRRRVDGFVEEEFVRY